MKKREKRRFLKELSFMSAAVMFISLLSLIVIGQPTITGRSVSVRISGATSSLGVMTSVLIALVVVAAILFLGSKLMESRL